MIFRCFWLQGFCLHGKIILGKFLGQFSHIDDPLQKDLLDLFVVGAEELGEGRQFPGNDALHKIVAFDHFFGGYPLRGVDHKHTSDQLLELEGELAVIRKPIQPALDFLVQSVGVQTFKGGLSDGEHVQNDPQGPDIRRVLVAAILIQNLGRNIIGRPADRESPFFGRLELHRQAEVAQLYAHVFGKKEVPELQIPVHDLAAVEVNDRQQQLVKVVLDLVLGQRFALFVNMVQSFVLAQLQNDINTFEPAKIIYYICVSSFV